MSALEAEYDEHQQYAALQRGDDLLDGPQVLAALLQRPPWHRQAACRGMGPAQFFGERPTDMPAGDNSMPPMSKDDRIDQVVRLRRRGLSLRAIGRTLGVSGEQVRLDLAGLNVRIDGPTTTVRRERVLDLTR